ERSAGALRERQGPGDRRPVRRDEGAHRRLLADRGQVQAGSDRMGEEGAVQSPAERRTDAGDRSAADVRAHRFSGRAGERRRAGKIVQSMRSARMANITPFLWFDNQAEAAAKFYPSVFPNSKIHKTAR